MTAGSNLSRSVISSSWTYSRISMSILARWSCSLRKMVDFFPRSLCMQAFSLLETKSLHLFPEGFMRSKSSLRMDFWSAIPHSSRPSIIIRVAGIVSMSSGRTFRTWARVAVGRKDAYLSATWDANSILACRSWRIKLFKIWAQMSLLRRSRHKVTGL
jgi:hypothetical protein